jgi:hypothetical protein
MMQNPANIQALVQQLAAQNPQIAQALGQNPEALMQLLGIEISDDADMEGQPIPPGAQVVSVTPEERAAIERVGLFAVRDWLKLNWTDCSWKHLGSLVKQSWRHTSPAIRMRSWQQTTYSRVALRIETTACRVCTLSAVSFIRISVCFCV